MLSPNKQKNERETKEGQEHASIGHLEIFSKFPVERQRKSRGACKERYYRCRTEAHERNNRRKKSEQQGYMR